MYLAVVWFVAITIIGSVAFWQVKHYEEEDETW